MMKFFLSVAILFSFSFSYSQEIIPTAESLLNTAYETAAKEHKNVFVIFQASWCGWCKKMDVAMNDASCRKIFQGNYVIVHLTTDESKDKKELENAGAATLKSEWLGKNALPPFWVILDKDGNVLTDSYVRKKDNPDNTAAQNIGCPSTDEEITAFLSKLRKTSTITDAKLETIGKRFKKNKQTL